MIIQSLCYSAGFRAQVAAANLRYVAVPEGRPADAKLEEQWVAKRFDEGDWVLGKVMKATKKFRTEIDGSSTCTHYIYEWISRHGPRMKANLDLYDRTYGKDWLVYEKG